MELSTFLLFAATTFVVVMTPGPAAIAVAAQASGNGFIRAQAAICGVAIANALFFVLSAAGISAMIIASPLIFTIIKWFGVTYLAYLGIGALFSSSGGIRISRGEPQSRLKLFGTGFLVEAANPKALLYFAAIVPQFLETSAPITPQLAIMGLTTLFFDLLIYSGYAGLGVQLSNESVRPWFVTAINKLAGSALLYSAFRVARISI